MSELTILAGKISKDPKFIKFLYKKGDQLYIRSGEDDFKVGKPLQTTLEGACYKMGFYKLKSSVSVQGQRELKEKAHMFDISPKGFLVYKG